MREAITKAIDTAAHSELVKPSSSSLVVADSENSIGY
jgi:hypothetical protein